MAITADGLASEILSQMSNLDENSTPEQARAAHANAIVKYLLENLEVKIPSTSVIISVVGGSGAPAVGTANPDKIDCEIS